MSRLDDLLREVREKAICALTNLITPPKNEAIDKIKAFLNSIGASPESLLQDNSYNDPKNVLNDLLGLWLWKYDRESDVIRHWKLVYPPYEHGKNEHRINSIRTALENVAVKGGRSSIGVLAWTGHAVILSDTAHDPRSSVSIVDYLIGDLSWVGVPVPVPQRIGHEGGKVHVELAVSFFLPYENAWAGRKEPITQSLSEIVRGYQERLLDHDIIETFTKEIDASLKIGTTITADEASVLSIIDESPVVSPSVALLLNSDGREWRLPSPKHLFIDTQELEYRLLHELEWCAILGPSDCNACPAVNPRNDGTLIVSGLLGVGNGSKIGSHSCLKNNFAIRFYYVKPGGDENREKDIKERLDNMACMAEDILKNCFPNVENDYSKEKRCFELRVERLKLMIGKLLGTLGHDDLKNTSELLREMMEGLGMEEGKNDNLLSRLLSQDGTISELAKLCTEHILMLEYWEKQVQHGKLKLLQQGQIKNCAAGIVANHPNQPMPLEEDDKYLKHWGTISVLQRIARQLSQGSHQEAQQTAEDYPPLYSLARRKIIEISKDNACKIELKCKDGNGTTVKMALDNDQEVQWIPRFVRLNNKLLRELVWNSWYKDRTYRKLPDEARRISDNRLTADLSPRWQHYQDVYAVPIALKDGKAFRLVLLNVRFGNGGTAAEQATVDKFIEKISAVLDLRRSERSHALRSAVAAIMARNMSHIHGSHIEPGLQHRMFTFEKLIRDRVGG